MLVCYQKNTKVKEQTFLKNYGVKCGLQDKGIRELGKHTCLKKYGVYHPSQNPEIALKMKISNYKDYILPSGKIVQVQGYEDRALDILLEKYDEYDLIISNKNIFKELGAIKYIGKDNKEHYYYPDIYIKSENKVIEVKSNYTFHKEYDKNILKKKACIKMGLDFEFMVLD
jgi:hypothetical protein